MTDTRLIVCARAMHAEGTGGNDFWDSRSDSYKQAQYDRARACILKWLEQEPTEKMGDVGADAVSNCYSLEPGEGFDESPAPAAYAAMCEQAKKEIGG